MPVRKKENAMPQVAHHPPLSELSYLDATKVDSPAGVLADLALVTSDGERVGNIAGVVIDAGARRVRYFDVQSPGWLRNRHYLVEVDHLAQVDPEQKVLRMLDANVSEVRGFDPAALHQFSDDDLLAAIFSARAS
jgi:hypothetical protein